MNVWMDGWMDGFVGFGFTHKWNWESSSESRVLGFSPKKHSWSSVGANGGDNGHKCMFQGRWLL